MNTFNITLDLNKGNVTTPIRLRQGDLDGTTITALILDHGATADLTGLSARFVMELPGGEHYYRKDATVGEGSVTVVINEEQAASVTGRTTRAYFQLLDGETVRASTGSVTVDILPDALEGHTVPADYDSAIQDAIDALDDAVENIADTVEDVLEDHPEWTTTVQDGAVTDAKLYQGADGILARNARMMYRLDNLLTNALPEGDSATATDAAKTPLAGLALYGRSTQDGTPTPSAPVAIQSVTTDSEGNISLWARGRNLLPKGTNRSSAGITYTVRDDGSVVVSGTASGTSFWGSAVTLPAGAYAFSGCPSGGNGTSFVCDVRNAVGGAGISGMTADSGSGGRFALDKTTTVYLNIRISGGYTANDLVFHPQIEQGTTATAYQPYTYTVTPIPLDGHELRSLPDGTRDELTVGADGRVTLVQRVGAAVIDGVNIKSESIQQPTGSAVGVRHHIGMLPDAAPVGTQAERLNVMASEFVPDYMVLSSTNWNVGQCMRYPYSATANFMAILPASCTTVTLGNAWLAENPVEVIYPLATPQTIDLGWTDAIPLCGPDLTAQAVPSAPFALTYERDLNVTLARLEAALAALA